jgi:hypothetical protein
MRMLKSAPKLFPKSGRFFDNNRLEFKPPGFAGNGRVKPVLVIGINIDIARFRDIGIAEIGFAEIRC